MRFLGRKRRSMNPSVRNNSKTKAIDHSLYPSGSGSSLRRSGIAREAPSVSLVATFVLDLWKALGISSGHYAYLCHALGLVHALRRGLLVGGHSGFYMGNLVHSEDAKLGICFEGIFTTYFCRAVPRPPKSCTVCSKGRFHYPQFQTRSASAVRLGEPL